MPAPKYRIQVFSFAATTRGYGTLLAEFTNPKNLGWSRYLNDVGEAFFTIYQDDPQLALVRNYLGKAHVKVYRNSDVVWAGWLGLEYDANNTDVVLYAFSYEAGLFWSITDWNKVYTNSQLDTIVSEQWTYAKTTKTDSMLNFVSTGTIEAPVTASGGATAIVLPTYSLYYKRILYVMQEMAALGASDTTNVVCFEITPSSPTFNFWKNRGSDKADVVFRYGDNLISAFRDYRMPVHRRNKLYVVGSDPSSQTLRTTWSDATDITAYGLREDSIYFSWVRDSTELDRAAKLRGQKAKRDVATLQVLLFPNAVLPPGATGAGFALADRVKVIINHGVTNINGYYLVTGVQAVQAEGSERVNLLLQERTGT